MKSLLLTYPIWMLIFVRSCAAVLVLVPLILVLGGPHRLTSPLWRLHLLRAALFSVGFSLFYTAFPFMGLAEVTTIFFSAPLMIAVMAAVFLKETIGIHRIGALVTGFAGVLIAMNPAGDNFTWISILPLVCAAFYAASQILARQIGERESSLTVGLYTLAFTGPILLGMGYLLNSVLTFGPEFHHLRWAIPAETLTELSGVQDFAVGDLLATGTPAGCALSVPSPIKQRLGALLPERKKWEIFNKVQAERTQYLKPGDVVEASIRSADGAIDLGTQRNCIVAA